MLKKIALAALLAAVATPAFAQEVTVNATVTATCHAPTAGSVMNLGDVIDSETGLLKNLYDLPTATSTISGVWCNSPNAEITATGDALENQDWSGTVPAGFTTAFGVEARVEKTDGTFVTDEGSGPHTLGLFAGDLIVRIGVWDEVNRPVAGAYTGTTTITLNPGS